MLIRPSSVKLVQFKSHMASISCSCGKTFELSRTKPDCPAGSRWKRLTMQTQLPKKRPFLSVAPSRDCREILENSCQAQPGISVVYSNWDCVNRKFHDTFMLRLRDLGCMVFVPLCARTFLTRLSETNSRLTSQQSLYRSIPLSKQCHGPRLLNFRESAPPTDSQKAELASPIPTD